MMVEMSFYSFCNLQSDFSTFHIYKTDTGNFGFGSGPDLKNNFGSIDCLRNTECRIHSVFYIFFYPYFLSRWVTRVWWPDSPFWTRIWSAFSASWTPRSSAASTILAELGRSSSSGRTGGTIQYTLLYTVVLYRVAVAEPGHFGWSRFKDPASAPA